MLKKIVAILAGMVLMVVAEEERKVPPGAFIARTDTNVGNPELWTDDFSYQAADGTVREETVAFRRIGEDLVPVVHGRSVFFDSEGNKYELKYVADEEGFRPEADYLPKPVEPLPLSEERPALKTVVETPSVPTFTTTTTTTTTTSPPVKSAARRHYSNRYV